MARLASALGVALEMMNGSRADDPSVFGPDRVAAISYVLRDAAGRVVDAASIGDPLVFMYGAGAVLPGLERGLVGASVHDHLTIVIPPEQGWGPRVEGLVQVLERGTVPFDPRPGLPLRDDAGRLWTVVSVDDERVVVDGNHPLAGAVITVDVLVVAVRRRSSEERMFGRLEEGWPW